MRSAQLDVTLLFSTDFVRADVCDYRPNTISLFSELTAEQREQLAHDAWSIGLRALAGAYTQAQEARLQDVGTALLQDIDRQLRAHIELQQQTISAVLGKFFDPADGQVTQRLASFVDDHGVLARLLEKYVAPQNSVLVQTLARQVGESSPLFKKLSPTDTEGLVKVLETQLRSVMDDGHAELVRALDPLAEDGAVARFLRSLRDELKGADEDRAKQLSTALAALDANDDSSLINRLVRETNGARQAVLHAVNPDAADSPMATMKQTLTALLKDHARSSGDALRLQAERQERFEKELREALARIDGRRTEAQRGPRGGLDFEDAVATFVTAAVQGAPCIVEVTADTAGLRTRCKKGDLLLRFTDESAFAGAGVVFEAKRDASFTSQRALAELEVARANRNACAGVFVIARSHAPEGFPRFARHGNSVLVVWNDSDPSSDPYLHAAILLGLGLATRGKKAGAEGDLEALTDIEGRVEDEIRRLDRMDKHNESIRKNSDGLGDEIRRSRKQLEILIRRAKSSLAILNVELQEEEIEKASPITLAGTSLDTARQAVTQTVDDNVGL
jgi:hypothetical protein